MIDEIEFNEDTEAKPGVLTVTIRGEATHIIDALIHGLPVETMLQLKEAFTKEMLRRGLTPPQE